MDPMDTAAPRRRSVASPLVKLLSVSTSTAYNVTLMLLIIFVANLCCQDVIHNGGVNLQIDGFLWSYGGFHLAICVWVGMNCSLLVMQLCFQKWASLRTSFAKQSGRRLLSDSVGLCAFALHLSLFLALPGAAVLLWSLAPATSAVLLGEQIRLVMKAYAYVRSQGAAVLREQDSPEPQLQPDLTLSHFLYFLFAPTLVYRDQYERTSETRLRVILRHLLEVVGGVFIVHLVFVHCVSPVVMDFLLACRPSGLYRCAVSWAYLQLQVLPAASFMFLIVFYLMLHAVQTVFAEALRFQNRIFFLDWWNVSSFGPYFRSWNRIVQGWLHQYVYKDLRKLGANSFSAKLAVFTISPIFHEYILSEAVKFVFPVQYIFFGFLGFAFSFEPKAKGGESTLGNFFFLTRIFLGITMLLTSYTVEYYARIICPRQIESTWDLVVPRSWFCSSQSNGTALFIK